MYFFIEFDMLEMDFISVVQILTGPFASSTTNSEEPDPLLAGPFIASPIIIHIFKDHASFTSCVS